jgi:hypothetical protein
VKFMSKPFAAALLVLLLGAPLALAAGSGSSLLGGARNPSSNQSQSFTRETQIIADNSTYGTRQSNKSDNGGGAIYGCRSGAGGSAKGNEPCVRANNLSNGLAFELASGGPLAGTITAVGGDNAKPFTTNATGVATGLNADRVDSKSASDIVADAVKAAQALTPFAQIASDGALGAHRGITSARRTGVGTYEVVFESPVNACALTATESTTDDAGAAAVRVGSDNKAVTVVTRAGTVTAGGTPAAITGPAPADKPFNLAASC